MRMIDITGQKFNRWTVLRRAENSRKGQARWLCRCDCGNEGVVGGTQLTKGYSKSCGCFRTAVAIKRSTKHGHATNGITPTYHSWSGMIARCTNPKHRNYSDYGGRGISVYPHWLTFANFLADMGEKPKGQTLDRIDSNSNYEPGNCHWASHKEQARNKRNNTFISWNGETHTIARWAELLNIPAGTISWRLNTGKPIHKVLGKL